MKWYWMAAITVGILFVLFLVYVQGYQTGTIADIENKVNGNQ